MEKNKSKQHSDPSTLTFEQRWFAQRVLNNLTSLLARYKIVSVADLFEFAGVVSKTLTDTKFGWDDLTGAKIIKQSGKFVLSLPDPIDLSTV